VSGIVFGVVVQFGFTNFDQFKLGAEALAA
jgi:hypothetical protein